MARRSGLGRGLGALIPTDGAQSTRWPCYQELPVGQHRAQPATSPGQSFDEETLAS